jgi:hypothetical protein
MEADSILRFRQHSKQRNSSQRCAYVQNKTCHQFILKKGAHRHLSNLVSLAIGTSDS